MDDLVRFERLDPAAPGLAAEIWSLQLAAYQHEARLLGAADFPPLRRSLGSVLSAPAVFYGLVRQGRLLAVAEVESEPQGALIAGFVVDPAVFRQGLGRRLLGELLARYAGQRLTVGTAAANAPALALYEA